MDRPAVNPSHPDQASGARPQRRSLAIWGTLIALGAIVAFLVGRSTTGAASSTDGGGLLYYLPFLLLMLPCLLMPFMMGHGDDQGSHDSRGSPRQDR